MAKRKQKNFKVIHIIIIAIILIAISAGVIKYINNKSDDNIKIDSRVASTQKFLEKTTEKYVKVLEDGTKLNTSTKLKEDKTLDKLKIQNIQLTYKDGVTNLLANIINTTHSKIEMQKVEIVLMDENGETLYKMPGIIETIEADGSIQFNSSVTADFSNAYDFKVVKK